MVQQHSKKFAGGALYRKIISESVAEAKYIPRLDPKVCFAAGTLVHTPSGLIPIQDLKVGDWVFSKPEDGTGKVEPKRVVNTFRFEKKPVHILSVQPTWAEEGGYEAIVATGNHPFWLRDYILNDPLMDRHANPEYRWWALENTGPGHVMMDITGREYDVAEQQPLYIGDDLHTGLAWFEVEHDEGYFVDFATGRGIVDWNSGLAPNWDFSDELPDGAGYLDGKEYCTDVYNIEVEDYHTYFVGEYGIWTHNTECGAQIGDIGTAKVELATGIVPTGKAACTTPVAT